MQREWDEIKKERDVESRTMSKLVEALKRSIKGFGESARLDKLMEYLSDQIRLIKEANRNQSHYFESLTEKLSHSYASSQDEAVKVELNSA